MCVCVVFMYAHDGKMLIHFDHWLMIVIILSLDSFKKENAQPSSFNAMAIKIYVSDHKHALRTQPTSNVSLNKMNSIES